MVRALLIPLLASVSPAWADVTTPSGRVIDCYCTDSTGGRVELGDVICLHVDGRMFLARCEMSLNNPMWREVREGCTTSRLERLLPARPAPRISGS
ncbi:hypothetical protein [Aliiruegeria lutimaris]|uniref:hypothetical protein n=1 Tax=Aliiruegeria lutimaris TaxID=571298 RepID=UPI000B83034D|nr:hypothetical protein [Aliiruegeria lutimaris]